MLRRCNETTNGKINSGSNSGPWLGWFVAVLFPLPEYGRYCLHWISFPLGVLPWCPQSREMSRRRASQSFSRPQELPRDAPTCAPHAEPLGLREMLRPGTCCGYQQSRPGCMASPKSYCQNAQLTLEHYLGSLGPSNTPGGDRGSRLMPKVRISYTRCHPQCSDFPPRRSR